MSARDGNKKLKKDLDRLGGTPSEGERFLVTSPEWGRVKQARYQYAKVLPNGTIVAQV